MQTLCVVGDGASDAVSRLIDRLEGRVATVRRRELDADGGVAEPAPEGAAAAYRVGDDGGWTASGTDRSFPDVLDDLATRYDYALVAGFSRLRLPTVVLGALERKVPGDVVARADTAEALDLDAVASELDDAEPHVTLETLVSRAKASPQADRAGAIATFTGRVRARDHPEDDRTTHLEFEKYDGVAAERMATIADELEAREGVFEVLFHHRTGVVVDGEDIVFVVVLAGHRREAFRTVEDGIDRLKEEVPLFKKETTTDEAFWVHDRA